MRARPAHVSRVSACDLSCSLVLGCFRCRFLFLVLLSFFLCVRAVVAAFFLLCLSGCAGAWSGSVRLVAPLPRCSSSRCPSCSGAVLLPLLRAGGASAACRGLPPGFDWPACCRSSCRVASAVVRVRPARTAAGSSESLSFLLSRRCLRCASAACAFPGRAASSPLPMAASVSPPCLVASVHSTSTFANHRGARPSLGSRFTFFLCRSASGLFVVAALFSRRSARSLGLVVRCVRAVPVFWSTFFSRGQTASTLQDRRSLENARTSDDVQLMADRQRRQAIPGSNHARRLVSITRRPVRPYRRARAVVSPRCSFAARALRT